MNTIERLTLESLRWIYEHQMINDFPATEIKPFWKIKSMFDNGSYSAYAYKDCHDNLIGYALFIVHPEDEMALLDYYAMNMAYRGKGHGSSFLQALRRQLDVKAFMIESELPEAALDDHDLNIRNKRIDFYKKNGAFHTQYNWWIYNNAYSLLAIPCKNTDGFPDFAESMKRIMGLTMSTDKISKHTRIKALHPELC